MRPTPRCSVSLFALLGACAGSPDDVVRADTNAISACPKPPPAPPTAACLFGEQLSDIRTNPALEITSETWIRSTDGLAALTAEQLVVAVQQSSHTDVTTAAEALAAVDEQELRDVELYELASGRAFTVMEYGVGDNSYGAFFEHDASTVVASIHDGDLLDCRVTAADGG
jgi:hypothetical protein